MTFESLGARWSPLILSILRIATGLFLMEHGTGKLLRFPEAPQYAKLVLSSWPGVAGYFELIGGALLVIGLFSRPVAFIMSGMCAVAYFMVHAPRGFFPILNAGELAAVYAFLLLYLAAAGPGPLSADAMIGKK